MFGKVKRKHNIYKTWSCHIPADVRILEWEAMRIFVESVLRFGMSEAKTVFWYFSKRSRKMSTLIILVQRPPSFASFIMSPKALKLVHFCCNHLDEVVPRERDANWKKTQKASWLAHFFYDTISWSSWYGATTKSWKNNFLNWMKYLIFFHPVGFTTGPLCRRVPFVAFAQGDTTLARKALADTLGKQASCAAQKRPAFHFMSHKN